MNTTNNDANEHRRDDDELGALLKSALPPVDDARHRDLWPQMPARLDSGPPLAARAKRVPWFDWVLAAAAVVCVACVPKVIPFLLFHL